MPFHFIDEAAVEQHFAAVGLRNAGDQFGKAGLAAAVRAGYYNAFPVGNSQVDVLEHRLVRHAPADIVEYQHGVSVHDPFLMWELQVAGLRMETQPDCTTFVHEVNTCRFYMRCRQTAACFPAPEAFLLRWNKMPLRADPVRNGSCGNAAAAVYFAAAVAILLPKPKRRSFT